MFDISELGLLTYMPTLLAYDMISSHHDLVLQLNQLLRQGYISLRNGIASSVERVFVKKS